METNPEQYSRESNNRQYELMLSFLLEFEKNDRSLSSLVSNLEAGLNCLENPNQEWKKDFMSQWGVLEDMYSFSQHSKKPLSVDDQNHVAVAIGKMKVMLQQKIK